jgi:nucleoside 2-deoxyribosyltransferase
VKVYLAGPINGCTDDQAINWREVAKACLGVGNCIDPMRRDYRGKEDESVDEIVHGDLDDINECDVVIANCWQTSWGTAMEIHYAATNGIPVVAVLPIGARVSPWLRYFSERIVYTLDAALESASWLGRQGRRVA